MQSQAQIVADLRRLGVQAGDHLMLHASLRALGPVAGGSDGLIAALDQAVGADGTLLMVLGAHGVAEWAHEPPDPATAAALRPEEAFDAAHTEAFREVGWLAEAFRRSDGTLVTQHPLGRFGARGRLATWLLADAPWDDYFGPGSPLDRLCQAGGRVLRLGADLGTVTLLHWAEYLVPLATKRRLPRYVAVAGPAGPEIRYVDALDDAEGIVAWAGEDYFALLLRDYLATGRARQGQVGGATSELLDARDLVAFAVPWMQAHLDAAP
jgi:aminoglycoside N3'-acetyltransferase